MRGWGPTQLLRHPFEPHLRGESVGPKLFQPPLLLAVKERAMEAQLAGQWRIDEVAGVGGTHLEQDAQLKLAQGLPVEGTVQIVEAITPDQCVNAHARALVQDGGELFGRARLLR